MKSRHNLINKIIKDRGYTSYLEVGTRKARIFTKVKCERKVGVTSSSRIKLHAGIVLMNESKFLSNCQENFDIILIDANKDRPSMISYIMSATKRLNEGGLILVRGCNPKNKDVQRIPRQVRKGFVGKVWEAWVVLRTAIHAKAMYCIDIDRGLGVIDDRYQTNVLNLKGENITYGNLIKNRKEWLNLVPYRAGLKLLKYT